MKEFVTLGRRRVEQVRDLPYPLASRGKVRDIFDLGDGTLLVVSTDRISVFDVVLPDLIAGKGEALTRLSVFWDGYLRRVVPGLQTHLVAANFADFPPALQPYREVLEGRSMIVRKLAIFPVECVVRGYLFGSGWTEYRKNGTVCGVKLPAGLREAEVLPKPIFTPTTKETTGHDEPVTFTQLEQLVGASRAAELRDQSIAIYCAAAKYAYDRRVIIADTKFEWGIPCVPPVSPSVVPIVLADEVLTPDSSRFWPVDQYAVGGKPPSLDKQHVRDFAERRGWNKKPPGPELSADVVTDTTRRYQEICHLLME
ncbi:MAG: phosphoribosylaminoimidazolesuccinocarboxamide synthase [Patescibacteria group bacterium]|nr:phosphoribosylaminoimidazolesuccinocarboxamide synthase [Patescibacteria group bacterium]